MRDRIPTYAYDTIVSLGIATEEELDTVKRCIGCTWEEVFEFILSVRTQYVSLNEFLEEQGDEKINKKEVPTMMNKEEIFLCHELIDLGIATAKEISLVKYCMGGTWQDVLESILYVRTGYRTIEQLFDDTIEQLFDEEEEE